MDSEDEKTREYPSQQDEENQDQAIYGIPLTSVKPGVQSVEPVNSAAQGLSSNASGINSGVPEFRPVNSAAQGLSSNASGINSGVPEFRPMNSAARGLSSNASGINPGVPEFKPAQRLWGTGKLTRTAGKAKQTVMKQTGTAAKAARTTAKPVRATAKAARSTGSAVRTAGKTVQTVGSTVRAAAPAAGRFASVIVKIKTVWLTVTAVTVVTAGITTVVVNPKTYTESFNTNSIMTEKSRENSDDSGTSDIPGFQEQVEQTDDVSAAVNAAEQISSDREVQEKTSDMVLNEQVTSDQSDGSGGEIQAEKTYTDGIMFAADGKYAEFGIPVDFCCNRETLKAGETITFKAYILGGTPPFRVGWYIEVSDDPGHAVKKEITTEDRYLEYTFTPSSNDESVYAGFDISDANNHYSDEWLGEGIPEYQEVCTEETWKERNPKAGKTLDEDFPFIAKTNQVNVNLRSGEGTDYPVAAVIPDAGMQLYVTGKTYDESGRKWYCVRLDIDRQGWIRSDLLRTEGKGDATAGLLALAEDRYYNYKSLPVDVYSDHVVYTANEPVVFTAEILGGTPPYSISWDINESILRDPTPWDAYRESHKDYQTSGSFISNNRHVEFIYIPPVESEGFGLYLDVQDAQGVRNDGESWGGGDKPPELWVYSLSEWKQANPKVGNPPEENFPFAAVTNTEKVNVRYTASMDASLVKMLPDKGTEVKVLGSVYDRNGTKWYCVRLGLDMKGYYIRSDLLDKRE